MAITAVVAIGVLLGWGLGITRLTAVVPGLTAMNPLSAVCFILTTTALVGSPLGATGRQRTWIIGVALVIGACGLVRLGAYALGWDLPLDQILLSSHLDLGGAQPNRMAPNTALNFVAVGVALLSLVAGRIRWAQRAVILVMLTSGIALIGYAYSVTSLVRVATFIPMALHTAGLFVMVSIATLCAMPEVGMIAMLTRRGPGSHVMRLMLPTFIVGTPLLGWLRLQGELAGLYAPAFGVAILIGAMVVLGLFAAWKIAHALDVAESERRRADDMMRRLAHHDALTGLPNRLMLDDRLRQALARADRENDTAAMLFMDLDGFKRVNDTLGHEAGDQVLKEAARRILSSVRTVDTAARLGGDEFTVVLEKIKCAADVHVVTGRLLDQLSRPYIIDGVEVQLSVSVGVSRFPADARTSEDLMKLADAAMYRAKRAGKNRVVFHSEAVAVPVESRQLAA
ncbi:MAG: GGDEF domain-containing protein [Polyangiales bacterium]